MASATRSLLYLASGSPRRAELLAQIGVPFTVLRAPGIDETPAPGESPRAYVERMAREKAAAGASGAPAGGPVLGADTAVVLGDRILGKPDDADHALATLETLNGREHRVISAVCVRLADNHRLAVSETRVRLRQLDRATLAAYAATGEGLDKAGAYGIQGRGAALVASITGSYSGVVGLPLAETVSLLEWAGVPYWQ
ncbi:Maf family protein [Alloalcanivorax gelatiniphagus]|uniref:dTTP/UTP pyrophosphatase n=1 Tax=Alloalcanivorax gelatiniphagus TaxID=1194167 RepID=A0ABY2XGY8_9GAMM|nr:Maf family protein [Alloalcanivorax gelatiniphagus]TMW10586.1 septum formation inhibitor Maf [Alloalcanivorax gelatiniphagus]